MNERLMKIWGDSCARSIAFQLIGFIVVLGIFVTPAIIVAFAIGDRNSGFGIYISIIIVLILAGIVGAILWGITSTRKRANLLDAIFTPWGLAGESYLYSGRQYHGEFKGRHVDVYFQRGPTLDIAIETPVEARAFVVFKSEIGKYSASLGNYEGVAINNPTFHNFSIYSQDKFWMENIIDDEPARQALRQLMRVTGAYELRKVMIQPKELKFTLRRIHMDEINQENIQAWFDDLFAFIKAVETAPAPQAATLATPIEEDPKQIERKSAAILASAAVCSVIAALGFCILSITIISLILRSFWTP